MHTEIHLRAKKIHNGIYIIHKTKRELIFSSKHSPNDSIPRTFLPTIEIVVHLISIVVSPPSQDYESTMMGPRTNLKTNHLANKLSCFLNHTRNPNFYLSSPPSHTT
jgi:hypothetical protein